MKVEIIKLYPDAEIPAIGSAGSAGVDLRAYLLPRYHSVVVEPNEVRLIGTGIAIYLRDPGFAGMILPRSGLGHKNGIILGNGTGLIDSDYQGELKISVWNRSTQPFTLTHGDRIAQYVIVPVMQPEFELVDTFEASHRGDGGFGSTGNQ
jgi:dUTP pyrophosphatase